MIKYSVFVNALKFVRKQAGRVSQVNYSGPFSLYSSPVGFGSCWSRFLVAGCLLLVGGVVLYVPATLPHLNNILILYTATDTDSLLLLFVVNVKRNLCNYFDEVARTTRSTQTLRNINIFRRVYHQHEA